MRAALVACLAAASLAGGCDCGSPKIQGGPGRDAATNADDAGHGRDGGFGDDGGPGCGWSGCAPGLRCAYGHCVPDVPCDGAGECQDDAWCDAGACVPWGVPAGHEVDDDCTREVAVGTFRPTVQCEWSGPPAGDPFPTSVHVLSTPAVVDFDFDDDPETIHPSIVFVSDDGVDGSSELPTGVVRVIDGGTCAHQYTIDAHLTSHSSPPAIGDLDGDGRAEFATAGLANYVVYDLDCVPGGGTGECGTGRVDGILWQMPSQDASSNRTGSSVFDFEGDGAAEAVYADECFVRVYQGATGDVLYSQYRSSCTWYENPIVADTDGDYNAELVVPSNLNCSPAGCPTCGVVCSLNVDGDLVDQLFAGLRCEEDSDCPTASSACDEGYCRCAADDECCPEGGCTAVGWRCAPPPAGTPGAGNTCRARHPEGTWGIRVYSDHADRWVDSRRVWNQHAYSVTNIEEDGTVPATSDVAPNWLEPGLNDFRANVQGSNDPLASPDLTVAGRFDCEADGTPILFAELCNRGTEPIGAGAGVVFRDGGAALCEAAAGGILDPGECEEVSCAWPADLDPPIDEPRDVDLEVDPDHAILECHEANNAGRIADVRCVTIE